MKLENCLCSLASRDRDLFMSLSGYKPPTCAFIVLDRFQVNSSPSEGYDWGDD